MEAGIPLSEFNIDNLPKIASKKFKVPRPSKETLLKVESAIDQAQIICLATSKKAYEEWPKKDENTLDICGFAYLLTYSPHSETTQALVDLKIVKTYGQNYQIWLDTYADQSISIAEAGICAAADYFTKELRQDFYCNSEWD